MTVRVNGGQMEVGFACEASKTSFSIFDLGGKEMKSGGLSKTDRHLVDISDMSAGIYNLCIIDGDQLHKTVFKIS